MFQQISLFLGKNNVNAIGKSSADAHARVCVGFWVDFLYYSKTCLKRNAIVPVFFFPRFHRFPFYKGLCFNKQSTKNMIA